MGIIDVLSHPYFVFLARVFLALIFLLSGTTKLLQGKQFAQVVKSYGLLPLPFSSIFALFLPWLELTNGLGLLVGLFTSFFTVLAITLFISFNIAVAIALRQGKKIDCNCFGNFQKTPISPVILLRNSIFIILAVAILLSYNGYLALDSWIFGWSNLNYPAPDGLIPIVFTIILFVLSVMLIRQVFFGQRQEKRFSDK